MSKEFAQKLFGLIQKPGHCVSKPIGCGEVAMSFVDEKSLREYETSGLCQECQDKIFGRGED